MKLLKLSLLVLITVVMTSFTTHKFYVSITKVEHSIENNSIQIISTIFIDDIEDVLQQRYDPSLVLGIEAETERERELLKKYVLLKLKFEINDTIADLNYVGHEYESDVVKLYLEIQDISVVKSISVENKMLMEVFEEQQNIIHFKKNKKRKSMMLDVDNPKGVLNF